MELMKLSNKKCLEPIWRVSLCHPKSLLRDFKNIHEIDIPKACEIICNHIANTRGIWNSDMELERKLETPFDFKFNTRLFIGIVRIHSIQVKHLFDQTQRWFFLVQSQLPPMVTARTKGQGRNSIRKIQARDPNLEIDLTRTYDETINENEEPRAIVNKQLLRSKRVILRDTRNLQPDDENSIMNLRIQSITLSEIEYTTSTTSNAYESDLIEDFGIASIEEIRHFIENEDETFGALLGDEDNEDLHTRSSSRSDSRAEFSHIEDMIQDYLKAYDEQARGAFLDENSHFDLTKVSLKNYDNKDDGSDFDPDFDDSHHSSIARRSSSDHNYQHNSESNNSNINDDDEISVGYEDHIPSSSSLIPVSVDRNKSSLDNDINNDSLFKRPSLPKTLKRKASVALGSQSVGGKAGKVSESGIRKNKSWQRKIKFMDAENKKNIKNRQIQEQVERFENSAINKKTAEPLRVKTSEPPKAQELISALRPLKRTCFTQCYSRIPKKRCKPNSDTVKEQQVNILRGIFEEDYNETTVLQEVFGEKKSQRNINSNHPSTMVFDELHSMDSNSAPNIDLIETNANENQPPPPPSPQMQHDKTIEFINFTPQGVLDTLVQISKAIGSDVIPHDDMFSKIKTRIKAAHLFVLLLGLAAKNRNIKIICDPKNKQQMIAVQIINEKVEEETSH